MKLNSNRKNVAKIVAAASSAVLFSCASTYELNGVEVDFPAVENLRDALKSNMFLCERFKSIAKKAMTPVKWVFTPLMKKAVQIANSSVVSSSCRFLHRAIKPVLCCFTRTRIAPQKSEQTGTLQLHEREKPVQIPLDFPMIRFSNSVGTSPQAEEPKAEEIRIGSPQKSEQPGTWRHYNTNWQKPKSAEPVQLDAVQPHTENLSDIASNPVLRVVNLVGASQQAEEPKAEQVRVVKSEQTGMLELQDDSSQKCERAVPDFQPPVNPLLRFANFFGTTQQTEEPLPQEVEIGDPEKREQIPELPKLPLRYDSSPKCERVKRVQLLVNTSHSVEERLSHLRGMFCFPKGDRKYARMTPEERASHAETFLTDRELLRDIPRDSLREVVRDIMARKEGTDVQLLLKTQIQNYLIQNQWATNIDRSTRTS